MQRFVTYIYAYENNNKNQNVGFAKVDIRGEYCQIEIHLKRTGYTNVKCPVYLFSREGGEIIGVEIGQIALVNGAGDFVRQLSCSQVGATDYCMNDMKGILIFLNDTVMFASQWDEKAIYRENFKPYGEAKQETAPQQPAEPERMQESAPQQPAEPECMQETAPQQPAEPERMQETVPQQCAESEMERYETPGKTMQTTVQTESLEAQGPKEIWQTLWEKLTGMYGTEKVFESAPQISGIRMELKDLKELPKKYWYLGSNSFLLHGFFNYRHLLLGRIEGEHSKKWFVGVPGVYQNQEKVLAAIFGFPEFKQEKDTEIKTNQFGYWYRFMDE